MTRCCQVCGIPTTGFVIIEVARHTITRNGQHHHQLEEQHRFLCPDHIGDPL
jgi:hypothetical protein